jgi:Flp pilus assembly protein TadG
MTVARRCSVAARDSILWSGFRSLPLACDKSGTAAVEFALVLVLFLSILFGIITFGFQFAARIALSYAVAEGGRSAVAGLTSTERRARASATIDRVLISFSPLIDPRRATVSVNSQGATAQGEAIEIDIDYEDDRFNVFPFLPALNATNSVKTVFLVADPSG